MTCPATARRTCRGAFAQLLRKKKAAPKGGLFFFKQRNRNLLASRRSGLAPTGQPTLLEQRLDLRRMAGEVLEQLHRIHAAALGQQRLAEVVAVLAAQSTMLAEPLLRVRIQHLGPDVR